MQRTQIRIVAGSLRGRKLSVDVHAGLRPTPQMVREALFSILGNAVPERPFFDVFAGTGVNGLEALSRGASEAVFVERDFGLAGKIDGYLGQFQLTDRGRIIRSDAYRWAERWRPTSDGPMTVFFSPPFADLTQRIGDFLELVDGVREKVPAGSVVVVQAEEGFPIESLTPEGAWDVRKYGRNLLLFWVKEPVASTEPEAAPESTG